VVKIPSPAVDILDVVIGWLTRVIVVLAVLGVFVFDGVAVGTARFGADDAGTDAAQAAATSWKQTHNLPAATDAAESRLGGAETLVPDSLTITPDGVAHLRVSRTVSTMVLGFIPGTKKLTHLTVSVSSGPALL